MIAIPGVKVLRNGDDPVSGESGVDVAVWPCGHGISTNSMKEILQYQV